MEILVDTAKSVRAIRDKKAQGAAFPGGAAGADVGGVKGAGEGSSTGAAAKCGGGGHYAYFKEGMLVSQSVALIDVALADFSILAASQAFRYLCICMCVCVCVCVCVTVQSWVWLALSFFFVCASIA